MQYAEKSSNSASNIQQKNIGFFTPQITNHLFYLIFNHKLIEYLQLKYEAKQKLNQANLKSQQGYQNQGNNGDLLTPRSYRDDQNQKHKMFKLDNIIEFNTILDNLKEKPFYRLYLKFKDNLLVNRYAKFITMTSQNKSDDSKIKKNPKKVVISAPKDKNAKRLQQLDNEEQLKIKAQIDKKNFKSNVFVKMQQEAVDKLKEFVFNLDKKYMLTLVMTTLDYLEEHQKEFELYNSSGNTLYTETDAEGTKG